MKSSVLHVKFTKSKNFEESELAQHYIRQSFIIFVIWGSQQIHCEIMKVLIKISL